MGDAMAKIWRNRIESKTQLYSDCPEKYQKQVLVFMREDVVARTLSAQEFKELTGIDYQLIIRKDKKGDMNNVQ